MLSHGICLASSHDLLQNMYDRCEFSRHTHSDELPTVGNVLTAVGIELSACKPECELQPSYHLTTATFSLYQHFKLIHICLLRFEVWTALWDTKSTTANYINQCYIGAHRNGSCNFDLSTYKHTCRWCWCIYWLTRDHLTLLWEYVINIYGLCLSGDLS